MWRRFLSAMALTWTSMAILCGLALRSLGECVLFAVLAIASAAGSRLNRTR
jgi:hypothetical protein